MRKVCMLCRKELEGSSSTGPVSHGLCRTCDEVYDAWMEGTIRISDVREARTESLRRQEGEAL